VPEYPVAGPLSSLGRLALPLEVTAGLVGGYRWIEQALFALLGSWAGDPSLPEVQVHLDAQSARHAWHAELWAEHLPRHGVDPAPPTPAATVLAALAALATGPEDTPVPARLAGLYRAVLPRLVVTYQCHLAMTSAITDGPLIRSLRLVLADEIEDWHAGELLVQRLVTRPHDLGAVHAVHRQVETLVVESGLGAGLVRLPGPISAG
jgi:hypothetical protein